MDAFRLKRIKAGLKPTCTLWVTNQAYQASSRWCEEYRRYLLANMAWSCRFGYEICRWAGGWTWCKRWPPRKPSLAPHWLFQQLCSSQWVATILQGKDRLLLLIGLCSYRLIEDLFTVLSLSQIQKWDDGSLLVSAGVQSKNSLDTLRRIDPIEYKNIISSVRWWWHFDIIPWDFTWWTQKACLGYSLQCHDATVQINSLSFRSNKMLKTTHKSFLRWNRRFLHPVSERSCESPWHRPVCSRWDWYQLTDGPKRYSTKEPKTCHWSWMLNELIWTFFAQ